MTIHHILRKETNASGFYWLNPELFIGICRTFILHINPKISGNAGTAIKVSVASNNPKKQGWEKCRMDFTTGKIHHGSKGFSVCSDEREILKKVGFTSGDLWVKIVQVS